MSVLTPEVQRALDRLHEACGRVVLPARIEGCGYCWPEDSQQQLLAPAGEVPLPALSSFSSETVDHFDEYQLLLQHLFPAIAQHLAQDDLHTDTQMVLSRLADAQWHKWPAPIRDAINDFLVAFVRAALTSRPAVGGSLYGDDVLGGAAAATQEADSWMRLWTDLDRSYAGDHLVSVIGMNQPELLDPDQDALGFWWPRGSARAVRAFLRQDWVKPAVQAANGPPASAKEQALQVLVQLDERSSD